MKIGVIGLGLIGGSIFKALEAKHELVGISSSVDLPNVYKDYSRLRDCELVFVCTPMSATLEILEKLDKILLPTTLVTDVCSLKGFVSQRKYSFKFIPSHPMAGTENCGWESSFPELFNGAKWVITPLDGKILDEQESLERVIESMGAKVVITTAAEHDKAVALISHMPLVIAQSLCENIKSNKLAQELASSGFRDTTRLALSNIQLASDMVELNSNNIKSALKDLDVSIKKLLDKDYIDKAKAIKEFRENLY